MKRENGITLIQMVITIVILLILAGVSISFIMGENSIVGSAQEVATGLDKERLELALSELVQNYTNEAGFKARGTGIDTYLQKNKYIEDEKTSDGSSRIFYKVDISNVLDEDIETGKGIEINEEEWTKKGEEVPKIEYMKEFYFIEVIKKSNTQTSKTANIKLLYFDRYGEEHEIYKFEDVYNIDNAF